MSESVLSRTKRFLQVGPYALWAVMNLCIILVLSYQRDPMIAFHYFVAFFGFGSLAIWFFGFKLFPQYLEKEGKMDIDLTGRAVLWLIFFCLGLAAHQFLPPLLDVDLDLVDTKVPGTVRVAIWIMMVVMGMIVIASMHVTNIYHQKQVERIGQQADRAQAELTLLKTQISPHFLFNTLNNIYGLAYLGDERAAKMISKLSVIMRYLLDDCERPKVPLVKEKELLEDYLSLQQLKHEGTRNVDFYHAGVNHTHSITPMVLINFVENCFKHSDLETNPEGWINISMEVDKDELRFRTENTIRKEVSKVVGDRRGIGLTNALKLLEANYPDRHEVEIEKTEQEYKLEITVKL